MKHLKVRDSLTARALLLGLINAGAVLCLALITMGFAYRRNFVDFLNAPIFNRIVDASRKISLDLLENDSESWDDILAREAEGTPFQFVLLDSSGGQIAGPKLALPKSVQSFAEHSSSQLSSTPKFQLDERFDREFTKGFVFLTHDPQTHMYWAGVHVLIHYMDEGMYGHGTLVWRFSSLWTNPYFFNSWPYIVLFVGALLITALCWLPAARSVLRRIYRLTQATREIAKGNFETTLPPGAHDEIGQLTDSIALMSRQISGLLHQQERFVSDAAHELCSPISRLQIALELLHTKAMAAPSADDALSREAYFKDFAEEVEQISEIVQDLLFYSRDRNQRAQVKKQDLEVASVVHNVIDRESLSAREVDVNIPPSLHVFASEPHLRRAIANLLRNAHQYGGELGKVEVAADERADGIHLLVRDQGPGIPESELRQVFAPFYRVERARSRATGGTGLGLAIVQSSVEACGGTVSCRNRQPSGLEVELTLPRVS